MHKKKKKKKKIMSSEITVFLGSNDWSKVVISQDGPHDGGVQCQELII